MKRKSWLLLGTLMVSIFVFWSFSGELAKYPGGSPGGYSGSPYDAKNCTQCHGGTSSTVTGWITSDIPVTGYVPGTAYTITATLTGSGKKGFEISPQTISGALVGTLTAGTGTHLCNSNKAVTQSSSSSANPYVWTFTWTAPAAGTGPVTFYGAFTVGKSVTKLSTAVFPEMNTGIKDKELYNLILYPIPAKDNLTLTYSLSHPDHLVISLYNLGGSLIAFLEDAEKNAGNHLERLNLPADLKPGMYLLNIRTKEGDVGKMLMVD